MQQIYEKISVNSLSIIIPVFNEEKTIEKKDGSYDLKINDQERSFTIGSNIGTDIVTCALFKLPV